MFNDNNVALVYWFLVALLSITASFSCWISLLLLDRVEPSPTAEIVSGRILAAPLFLEIVRQKGQYRGFRGYSPNRSIKVWRRGLLSGGVKRESMAWFVHEVPVTSAEVAGRIVNPSPVLISYCALQQVLSAAAPPTKAPVQYM